MKTAYEAYVAEVQPETYQQIFGWSKESAPQFDVVLGDIFEQEWAAESDMIFCNSTCFTGDMMEQLYQTSLSCKRGTWFITMSKRLPNVESYDPIKYPNNEFLWEYIMGVKLMMSWGMATVHLHRKRMHPIHH